MWPLFILETRQQTVLTTNKYGVENVENSDLHICHTDDSVRYRGADKSLARPERKQATATEDFDVHMSYL